MHQPAKLYYHTNEALSVTISIFAWIKTPHFHLKSHLGLHFFSLNYWTMTMINNIHQFL